MPEEKQTIPMPAQEETQNEPLNLAYKAIFCADGVIFLFEEVEPFSSREVKVERQKGEVFLVFGKNYCPITKNVMRVLEKTRTLFLYRSPKDGYDEDSMPVGIEIEEDAMAELRKVAGGK